MHGFYLHSGARDHNYGVIGMLLHPDLRGQRSGSNEAMQTRSFDLFARSRTGQSFFVGRAVRSVNQPGRIPLLLHHLNHVPQQVSVCMLTRFRVSCMPLVQRGWRAPDSNNPFANLLNPYLMNFESLARPLLKTKHEHLFAR